MNIDRTVSWTLRGLGVALVVTLFAMAPSCASFLHAAK
jgi:hypothetical protein